MKTQDIANVHRERILESGSADQQDRLQGLVNGLWDARCSHNYFVDGSIGVVGG